MVRKTQMDQTTKLLCWLEDNKHLFPELDDAIEQALNEGWQLLVADQQRGYCNYDNKIVVIPTWVLNRPMSQLVWYVAHEFSHVLAGRLANHGPIFMEILKHICPKEYIHHELSYKPRNAMAAGIAPEDF